MAIKKIFLNLQTEKALRLYRRERASTSFDKSNHFGILFTSDSPEKIEAIKSFSQSLKDVGKEVFVLEFVPKVKKDMVPSGFPSFNIKDITLFGRINNQDEEKFIRMPFDYLFLADHQPHPVLFNLLARSHSKCRVGQNGSGRTAFLDLLIEMPGTTSDLLKEMLAYTKKLS